MTTPTDTPANQRGWHVPKRRDLLAVAAEGNLDEYLSATIDDLILNLQELGWTRTRVDRVTKTYSDGVTLGVEWHYVHGCATARLLLLNPEDGQRTDLWTGTCTKIDHHATNQLLRGLTQTLADLDSIS